MKTKEQAKISRQPIEITEIIEQRVFALLRVIGYALLIFTLIDYCAALIPPRLTDPSWEFQVIGRLVDIVWAPLLGMTFIFLYNRKTIVSYRQLSILRFFSWSALFLGIAYILMLPLVINNSLTLYRNINNQFTLQQVQQQEQLQQLTTKVNTLNSAQELNNLAKILNLPNEADSNQSSKDLQHKLSQQLKTFANNASSAANAARQEQIKNLIKASVKTNLGLLLSGFCFITLWKLTDWVRVIDKIFG
ncbi:HpsJ family protein [Chlorogloeopsis sp. ULAP01]|uniref:HpsJ-like protein, cyanoexosortase A-associated n=1 Tax=Chlorogloeopsis sp. ULAP01 TaxID=3056483 RepID=UPI0025AA32CF|nr:HpsJ family protein [Chlorogloeopsis sp. ULAP01]MDM9383289.1 HpsJ family protein [Chlorogloeopsis sp. ULAP01]